jgi:hypothetical protein
VIAEPPTTGIELEQVALPPGDIPRDPQRERRVIVPYDRP